LVTLSKFSFQYVINNNVNLTPCGKNSNKACKLASGGIEETERNNSIQTYMRSTHF